MDDLVKNKGVVGAALVKAVTSLMPGESIEHVLDTVRIIMLKRVAAGLEFAKFSTIIHLVSHLKTAGLTTEDVKSILSWLQADPEAPLDLRSAASSLLASGLSDDIFQFVSDEEPLSTPPGCFFFRICKRSKA